MKLKFLTNMDFIDTDIEALRENKHDFDTEIRMLEQDCIVSSTRYDSPTQPSRNWSRKFVHMLNRYQAYCV